MHVCVSVGQYLTLDVDHNGMLNRDEIARQVISRTIVVFSVCHSGRLSMPKWSSHCAIVIM